MRKIDNPLGPIAIHSAHLVPALTLMPAIRKPLSEITPEDLQSLIADSWAEDELLEFKETLPGRGAARDQWLIDQTEVGTAAKRDLLAEVVGMANSYGGDVVLGLKEGDALPHRAEALTPLPRCLDLARRIAMFARDHIRPEIPLLTVRGIPTGGESGVVVIRVPRSTQAPHRLEISGTVKECYKRVQDRTEAMSMREIQDLTLDTARGIELVNQRLERLRTRHEEFCECATLRTFARSAISYSVRAAPLAAGAVVSRVHKVPDLISPARNPRIAFREGQPYECFSLRGDEPWRAMLRGTRTVARRHDMRNLFELSNDGACLSSALRQTHEAPDGERGMFLGWLLANIIVTCDSADRFRKFVGAETMEFALEIELESIAAPHKIMRLGSQRYTDLDPATLNGRMMLPRYSLGPVEERAVLLTSIYEDFWAHFEVDAHGEPILSVTF